MCSSRCGSMIVRSAARLGGAVVWTDLNPGQATEGVTVRNPFASSDDGAW